MNFSSNVTKSQRGAITAAVLLIVIAFAWPAFAAPQESKPSSGSPSASAENGRQLFVKYGCYECHGREGQGSSMSGPRVAPNPPPYEVISGYIRKPTGEMPPYTAKVLPDKDLADIYAFLQTRTPAATAKASTLLK